MFFERSFLCLVQKTLRHSAKRLFDVGVLSLCVPPLPIPNREVKASQSHDTCLRAGKVGCADIKVPFKKEGRNAYAFRPSFLNGTLMSAHPTFPARRQVSWDWDAFTSLFGMGRGGTHKDKTPTSKSRFALCRNVF